MSKLKTCPLCGGPAARADRPGGHGPVAWCKGQGEGEHECPWRNVMVPEPAWQALLRPEEHAVWVRAYCHVDEYNAEYYPSGGGGCEPLVVEAFDDDPGEFTTEHGSPEQFRVMVKVKPGGEQR